MANNPSPKPDDETADKQKALAKRYRPSIALFAVIYMVSFGVYYVLMRGPLPDGETHASLLAGAVLSAVTALGFITGFLRFRRGLSWWQAFAYAATVVGAMFCANIARIFLLLR